MLPHLLITNLSQNFLLTVCLKALYTSIKMVFSYDLFPRIYSSQKLSQKQNFSLNGCFESGFMKKYTPIPENSTVCGYMLFLSFLAKSLKIIIAWRILNYSQQPHFNLFSSVYCL